jgi:hypothetical protein
MHNPSHHNPGPHGPRDYEDRDIHLRPILLFGIGTAVFTVITFYVMKHILFKLESQTARRDVPVSVFAGQRLLPPEPLLQVDEVRNLQEQRAVEQARMSTYGWVDPAAGVARIPVERAIQLITERGLPTWEPAAPAPANPTQHAP